MTLSRQSIGESRVSRRAEGPCRFAGTRAEQGRRGRQTASACGSFLGLGHECGHSRLRPASLREEAQRANTAPNSPRQVSQGGLSPRPLARMVRQMLAGKQSHGFLSPNSGRKAASGQPRALRELPVSRHPLNVFSKHLFAHAATATRKCRPDGKVRLQPIFRWFRARTSGIRPCRPRASRYPKSRTGIRSSGSPQTLRTSRHGSSNFSRWPPKSDWHTFFSMHLSRNYFHSEKP